MFFPTVSIIIYKETERFDRRQPVWKAMHMLYADAFQDTRFRGRKKGRKKEKKGEKRC